MLLVDLTLKRSRPVLQHHRQLVKIVLELLETSRESDLLFRWVEPSAKYSEALPDRSYSVNTHF